MKRFFIYLLVAAAACAFYWHKNPLFFVRIQGILNVKKDTNFDLDATKSLTYQLSTDRWTEFDIPYNANRVKVVTNILIPQASLSGAEELHYSVAYQIVDANSSKILREATYHFRSKLSLYRAKPTDEVRPALYLGGSTHVPADGRIMQMDLLSGGGRDGSKRIRFRVDTPDKSRGEVLLRIYMRTNTALQKGAKTWNRFHITTKEKLARGNVYPYDLLNDSEINNVVQNQWIPAGPTGIPNRDYVVRNLYVRKEPGVEVIENLAVETTPHYGPNQRFTFSVPEEGSDLQFVFSVEKVFTDKKVTIHWYGRDVLDKKTWSVALDSTQQFFGKRFEGGIIEIIPDVKVNIRVMDNANHNVELSPVPIFSKMYMSQPDRELSYSILHIGSHPTPVKITIRSKSDNHPEDRQSFRYRLTDADNVTVEENTLYFETVPSRYDQLTATDNQQSISVSDPVHFYLRLPPGIKGLHLGSNSTVMFSVSNRPPTLVRETMVPEHYYRSSLAKGIFASWFPISPLMIDAAEQASALVLLQHRPPDRRQEIIVGDYEWESFRPDANWQGKYLLTPRSHSAPLRTEAVASIYHELSQNSLIQIHCKGPEGLENIRPKLIYLRDTSKRVKLQMYVGGKEYYSKFITGKRGTVSLPSLSTGKHSIKISGVPDGRVFMSNLAGGDNPHLRRFAYILPPKGLSFTFSKVESEELLSFYYYAPCSLSERTRLTVTLFNGDFASGPHADFTQLERFYDIRTGDEPHLPLLYSHTDCTDSGQRFYFPLGSDIANGKYMITIQPQNSAGGFLLFYRVSPGKKDWSKFFREEV